MILGISEHLGVRISLGIVRVDSEPAPQVYSEYRFRPGGTHATGQVGITASLDFRIPSYSWCLGRCCGLLTCDHMAGGSFGSLILRAKLSWISRVAEVVWLPSTGKLEEVLWVCGGHTWEQTGNKAPICRVEGLQIAFIYKSTGLKFLYLNFICFYFMSTGILSPLCLCPLCVQCLWKPGEG